MSINFEENNNYKSRVILGQEQRPKMIDLVLKTGLVKTDKSAATVLMTLSIVIFVVSMYVIVTTLRGPVQPPVEPLPIIYPTQQQ